MRRILRYRNFNETVYAENYFVHFSGLADSSQSFYFPQVKRFWSFDFLPNSVLSLSQTLQFTMTNTSQAKSFVLTTKCIRK